MNVTHPTTNFRSQGPYGNVPAAHCIALCWLRFSQRVVGVLQIIQPSLVLPSCYPSSAYVHCNHLTVCIKLYSQPASFPNLQALQVRRPSPELASRSRSAERTVRRICARSGAYACPILGFRHQGPVAHPCMPYEGLTAEKKYVCKDKMGA